VVNTNRLGLSCVPVIGIPKKRVGKSKKKWKKYLKKCIKKTVEKKITVGKNN